MGRRKKDDDTFLLALGLLGAGWLACKAAKALFSMPKIPNPPPYTIPKDEENETIAFVIGIFFLIVAGLFSLLDKIFVPFLTVPLICFILGFVYRSKRLKKKMLQQKQPFISNKTPVAELNLLKKDLKKR